MQQVRGLKFVAGQGHHEFAAGIKLLRFFDQHDRFSREHSAGAGPLSVAFEPGLKVRFDEYRPAGRDAAFAVDDFADGGQSGGLRPLSGGCQE